MKLKTIKDINGSPYIGIELNTLPNCDNPVLYNLLMFSFENIKEFKDLHDKLLTRNHGTLHITVFNVMECGHNKDLLKLDGLSIPDIKLDGVGSISKNDMTTFFIPVISESINILRNFVNLKEKDLHITIGFTHKDLFHDKKQISNIKKL